MALFQPSYVSPDARNGLGVGTVDATQDLTVSWHINGSNAMVAFQITIYQNNSVSTQRYTTGKLTDGCPVYGTSANGTMQFFSYTIPAASLASASVTNGNAYKLIIKQWWGSTDTESVTQSSASAFITRSAPSVSINAIGASGVINTRDYTFSGSYTQAEGDVLNWFRWQIATAGATDAPFFDTKEITGTMDLQATYDGFVPDTDYVISLTVQTENGVEATSGWIPFSAAATETGAGGLLSACCVKKTNAVYVSWSAINDIIGNASGDYEITADYDLVLPSGSSVTWSETASGTISLANPWTFLWRGTLPNNAGTFLTLAQSDGNITMTYSVSAKTITVKKGSTTLATLNDVFNTPTVTLILAPDTVYMRAAYLSGGLYPSTTLYPTESRYPAADTVDTVLTPSASVSYTQQPITGITVSGPATTDFIETLNGAPSSEVLDAAWTNGTYTPSVKSEDYMLAAFTNGLDASNLDIGGETVTGYTLYRLRKGTSVLQHVIDVDATVYAVYDYGVQSGQGPYIYYLFPLSGDSYVADPIVSNEISPLFADWSVMECVEDAAENGRYTVLREYRFGKNLQSGSVSNNNAPNILQNFTKYPTVQLAPQNYKSGSLQSLIGFVDYTSGADYYDTLTLRDELFNLSVSQNVLFLKSRKGDLIRIRISGAMSVSTADNTFAQAQTISLPWVEIGDAEGISIYSLTNMSQESPYTPSYTPTVPTTWTMHLGPDGTLTWTTNDGTAVPPAVNVIELALTLLPDADAREY